MSSEDTSSCLTWRINEAGLINNMFGNSSYSSDDAFTELIHNSKDWGANNISIEVIEFNGRKYLQICDNGVGMEPGKGGKIDNFLDLAKENTHNVGHGKYGHGAKAAIFRLSGYREFHHNIYTREEYRGMFIF